MKKTYIKPAAEILHISTQNMIAASGIIFDDDNLTGSGSLNDDDAIDALSRGLFNF